MVSDECPFWLVVYSFQTACAQQPNIRIADIFFLLSIRSVLLPAYKRLIFVAPAKADQQNRCYIFQNLV
jgi:hypothetical protein